jgi:hypothetical protein
MSVPDEATFRKMIEHGRMGSDVDWVSMGQVGGPRAEDDIIRGVDQRRQEQHRVGDTLCRIG